MLFSCPRTNKCHLIQRAEEVWNDMEEELVNNLIDSMPRRIAAVIKARG